MLEKVNEPVSVKTFYNHLTGKVAPQWVTWNGNSYPITKIGMHHTYRKGRVLYHIFSVTTPTLFLRLCLNSDTLHWKLEEIADGLPD